MDNFKYWAFISYSHQDKKWGDWLHKALETYRIPARLVGTKGRETIVPKRLYPVFVDRQELPGSANLGNNIEAALMGSRYLIVICSPRSASSRWVNEEVKRYKALGREDHILCLIVDGEPNASDKPGRESEECFPEAIRYRVNALGEVSDERVEPIAADMRLVGDRRKNAQLKLISGLLGINYDQLKQRDKVRQRWRFAAAGVLGLMLCGVAGSWVVKNMRTHQAEVRARIQRIVTSYYAERALTNFFMDPPVVSDSADDNSPAVASKMVFFSNPLLRAINEGQRDKALAIIEETADVNVSERLGANNSGVTFSALDLAIWRGDLPVIKALVAKGANTQRAIAVAAAAGQWRVAEEFLPIAVSADVWVETVRDALSDAAPTRFLADLLRKEPLVAWFADEANVTRGEFLDLAVNRGEVAVVKAILAYGVPVQGRHLLQAVQGGNVEISKVLLGAGLSPDERFVAHEEFSEKTPNPGVHGGTALHFAAYAGNDGILTLLLDKGADIHAQDQLGWTPLHWAVIGGHPKTVLLLRKNGADRYRRDMVEQSSVELAQRLDNRIVVRALLKELEVPAVVAQAPKTPATAKAAARTIPLPKKVSSETIDEQLTRLEKKEANDAR